MLNKNILISMARPFFIGGLVFLCVLTSCKTNDNKGEILIQWEGTKAAAVIIPSHVTGKVTQENISERITVTRKGNATSILGEYQVLEYETVFRPTIPFTPGATYEVWRDKELADIFSIKIYDSKVKAEVLQVYPTSDTVPVNLLKIYIQFSLPMQSGDALQHISLVKDGKDTLKNVFLDLQNELWSNDQKTLTLWFDPGRIKRGLQPNELLGPPLEKGHHYKLIVHKDWNTEGSVPLQTSFEKKFFTIDRDDQLPDMTEWELILPKVNTKDPLLIISNEPLDYQSAKHSIAVYNSDESVAGRIEVANNERHVIFRPDNSWETGKYYLGVETSVEDRAGNNLLQPFDNDLKKSRVKEISPRFFTIQ